MMSLEPQDWNEMIKLLRDTEESLSAMSAGDGEQGMERSRQSLMSFYTTAAMLGLEDLSKAGVELGKFLADSVPSGGTDSISVLGFAVSSLADQMRNFKKGNGSSQIDLNEILEILGPSNTVVPAIGGDEMAPEPGAESSDVMN